MVKLNVHCRLFSAPPEALQSWIEATWSGTPQDAFPRDVIKSWRKNPPGVDPLALVPGKTKLGHGGFTFHFREWNGERWRVEFNGPWFNGWHGFELRELGGGAHLMHTISLQATGLGILLWRLLIEPLHDWAVEAMFDRLETAVGQHSGAHRATDGATRAMRFLAIEPNPHEAIAATTPSTGSDRVKEAKSPCPLLRR